MQTTRCRDLDDHPALAFREHRGRAKPTASNKPYILSILSYMHVIYENIHKRVFCSVCEYVANCWRVEAAQALFESILRQWNARAPG